MHGSGHVYVCASENPSSIVSANSSHHVYVLPRTTHSSCRRIAADGGGSAGDDRTGQLEVTAGGVRPASWDFWPLAGVPLTPPSQSSKLFFFHKRLLKEKAESDQDYLLKLDKRLVNMHISTKGSVSNMAQHSLSPPKIDHVPHPGELCFFFS